MKLSPPLHYQVAVGGHEMPVWEAAWVQGDGAEKVVGSWLCLAEKSAADVVLLGQGRDGSLAHLWPDWRLPPRKHWGGGALHRIGLRALGPMQEDDEGLLIAGEQDLFWGLRHARGPQQSRPYQGAWAWDAKQARLFTSRVFDVSPADWQTELWESDLASSSQAGSLIGCWPGESLWELYWDQAQPDRLVALTVPRASRAWHQTRLWVGERQGSQWHWQLWEQATMGACLSVQWHAQGLRLASEHAGRLHVAEWDLAGRFIGHRTQAEAFSLGERSREPGRSFMATLADGSLYAVMSEKARQSLCRWDEAEQAWLVVPEAAVWTHIPWLAARPDGKALAFIGASAEQAPSLIVAEPARVIVEQPPSGLVAGPKPAPRTTATWAVETVEAAAALAVVPMLKQPHAPREPRRFFADDPRCVTLSSGVHARYYPPAPHEKTEPSTTTKPSATTIVLLHNGPEKDVPAGWQSKAKTYAAWGFATVYINYAGALRYERALLEALTGAWGEREVQDTLALIQVLTEQGLIDPARLILMGGGSATISVFQCLVSAPDLFCGAVAVFPWADALGQWARLPTGEARYLRQLLAPACRDLAAMQQRWQQHIQVPLLLIDGDQRDAIGREVLAQALRQRRIPVQTVLLPGEQAAVTQAASRSLYQASLQGFFAATTT